MQLDFPEALKTRYSQTKISEPIVIENGDVELSLESKVYKGTGAVLLNWFPYPRVEIEFNCKNMYLDFDTNLGFIKVNGLLYDGKLYLIETGTDFHRFIFRAEIPKSLPQRKKVKEVKFHLVNAPQINGKPIKNPTKMWAGRLEYTSGRKLVTIDIIDDFKLVSRNEKEGGYLITHIGRIKNINGSLFDFSKVSDILNQVGWYFSFLKGGDCFPSLISILNEDDMLFNYHICWKSSPFRNKINWLPKQDLRSLKFVWKSITKKLNKADSKTIKVILSWYFRANDEDYSESRIVFAQITLVMLANYLYPLSLSSGKKEPSINAIRRLVSNLLPNLDTKFPKNLKHLLKAQKIFLWQDYMQSITSLRNWIEHPTGKNIEKLKRISPMARYELSILSLWLLEVCLLKWLEYPEKSSYLSRISKNKWAGEYDPLP